MGIYLTTALFAPLIGFLISGFFGRYLSKGIIGTISSLSVLVSFICSVVLFIHLGNESGSIKLDIFNWITAGNINIDFNNTHVLVM